MEQITELMNNNSIKVIDEYKTEPYTYESDSNEAISDNGIWNDASDCDTEYASREESDTIFPKSLETVGYNIREFNLDKMVSNPAIVMIAKRGSGKSFIVRDLMHHYRDIPCGAVIAPTDRMNSFYRYFFPDLYIHYNMDNGIIDNVLKRQTLLCRKSKHDDETVTDRNAVLVMDDFLETQKGWLKNKSITEVLMNGRHYGLTYLLTMQTPLGITPDLRLNFDYIFLLKEDSVINKKKLWDNYASMFPTFAAFEKVFDKCTEDYGAMVIDNRKPSNDITEKVFWYKAQDRKFTFGSVDFLLYHKNFYESDYQICNLSKPSSKKYIAPDNEYLYDYLVNTDKLNKAKTMNYLLTDNSDCETTDAKSYIGGRRIKSSKTNDQDDKELLQFEYNDDDYRLYANITNLNNIKLIKTLCNHLENLRN